MLKDIKRKSNLITFYFTIHWGSLRIERGNVEKSEIYPTENNLLDKSRGKRRVLTQWKVGKVGVLGQWHPPHD